MSESNEYFYDLKDPELLNLINQVTGADANSGVSKMTLSTFKNLRHYAKFDSSESESTHGIIVADEKPKAEIPKPPIQGSDGGVRGLGFNLAYTINLNLPASSDQAVFNAIFRSLKEHLLAEPE